MTCHNHIAFSLGLYLGLFLSKGRCLENLALHKPAWLSSLYNENGGGEKAVAGTDDSSWDSNQCSHTSFGDDSPWLIVDLLGQYYVQEVYIINRQDCCTDQLQNFIIEVFQTNPTRCASANGSVCLRYPGVFGASGTLQCDTHVLGRFVRVWKPEAVVTAGHDETLLICELKIYGGGQECKTSSFIHTQMKRLESASKTTTSTSTAMSCVKECQLSGACVGVNYNSGTRVCELLTRPEPTDVVSSDANWVYYGHDLC